MPRTRFGAAAYLILVFASGILVGIVSHRLYETTTVNANNTVAQAPRTMDDVRKRYLSDMRAKVGVNDDQIASVTRILDETKRKFDDLHREEKPLRDKIQQEQVEAIRMVLNDQQRTAYENWRAERARLQAADLEKKKLEQQKK
jgi:hypothetical protein